MTAFNAFKEDLKSGGSQIQSTFDSILANFFNMGASLRNLNFSQALNDIKQIGLTSDAVFGHWVDRSKMTEEAMKGFNDVVRAGVPVTEALTASNKDLEEAHRLVTLATLAGKNGQQALSDALVKSKGDVGNFIKSLQDAEPGPGELRAQAPGSCREA
jgi:hypothetical protein